MVVAFCATTVFAQVESDIRTATLVQSKGTTVFYGASAFADACNAAAEKGDVIVLSPGHFNDVTITKSITIYGAGYETDAISGAAPTEVANLYISAKTDYDDYGNKIDIYPAVCLEGVCVSSYFCVNESSNGGVLENLVVRKCKFGNGVAIHPKSNNCKFSQCVILGHGLAYYSSVFPSQQNQLNFENCWLQNATGANIESTITYDHCIITQYRSGYAHVTNSIMQSSLTENCTADNNIFTVKSIGSNITGTNNWTEVAIDQIFADASAGANYSAVNDFKLRFPAKFVGTDGTEVGINGGVAPFDRISPIPRILSSDIDLRTSADGKLKVSIQVEAQTKE